MEKRCRQWIISDAAAKQTRLTGRTVIHLFSEVAASSSPQVLDVRSGATADATPVGPPDNLLRFRRIAQRTAAISAVS